MDDDPCLSSPQIQPLAFSETSSEENVQGWECSANKPKRPPPFRITCWRSTRKAGRLENKSSVEMCVPEADKGEA